MESMNKKKKKNKKAIFFTVDALIASGILLVGLVIIPSFHINKQPTIHLSFLSEDILGVMTELRINEINHPYIAQLIADGNITHTNNTIIEQIGEFWAEDNNAIAENFTQAVLGGIIPLNYGYSILVDGEELFSRAGKLNYSLISSRKIVSGYAKLQPILGFTSKTFLTGIKDRTSYSFAYFGGLEGQGNITKRILLPQNMSNITEAYLEVDVGDNFDLYINDIFAGSFLNGSGNGSYLVPDKWIINSSYYSYFNAGENNFSIKFLQGLLDSHYIAGGFLRVKYVTTDTEELGVTYNPGGTATKRYWFPEIKGIVNLYSSFDVPGTLQSMSLHLHIDSDYATYITIGNRLIWLGDENVGEQTFDVNNVNFTSPPAPLDYIKMSNSTTPLRLASYNLLVKNNTAGDLDLIIITDMSGSMKKSVSDNSLGNLGSNCADVFIDSTVRRTQLAKCLDKLMIEDVMAYSGVRIWLVELYNTDDITSWTRDTAEELYDVIDTDFDANGKGKTCLSCAVNEAYNIFEAYSSANRSKALVLMTDGIPTHTSVGNTTVADQEICVGYCDTTGACGVNDIEGCDDDKCAVAADDTEQAVQRMRDDFEVDIYGVGFGPVSQCTIANDTLREIIEPPNGTYYSSNNSAALKDIYNTITQEILINMDQYNQTIKVVGDINSSFLFGDSYIEFNYTPIVNAPVYGQVPVTAYGVEFGNNISQGTINIPDGVELVDLRVTSYSDTLWTDNVTIDNGVNISNAFGLYGSSLNYTKLGDPFIIQIPVDMAANGVNNTITVQTGSEPYNSSGGSPADRLIYTVRIDSLLDYGSIFFKSEGCIWHVNFEDGTNDIITIPSDYVGSANCYYANATYDTTDAMADAAYRLFARLDFNNNGKPEIKLDENNLGIDTITVSDIPSLWGPAIVEVRVW